MNSKTAKMIRRYVRAEGYRGPSLKDMKRLWNRTTVPNRRSFRASMLGLEKL